MNSRLSFIAGVSLCGSALAGGTGENAVLLIDPTDPVSLRVGNHYKQVRRIPDGNVIYLRSESTGYAAFVATHNAALLASLAQRGLDDHVDFVILSPTPVYTVPADGLFTDGCSPVNVLSVSTSYSTAYIAPLLLPGGIASTYTNQFYSTATSGTPAFNSRQGWLGGVASNAASARRYFVSGLLGYTAGTGNNTPEEILAMIDRSAAVDGTRPPGTFYFCNNPADPARNVRASGYSFPVNALNFFGATALVVNNTVLPAPNTNCLGIMTGNATLGDLSTIGIRPGAFCDHLTSYAAVFSNTGQSRVCAWIAAGASASAGEVDEPCNYTQKFASPYVHVFAWQGLTLGEAWFRSVQAVPFQGLFYGDPLTRPYVYIPAVTVANAPTDPVSGTISITASASTTRPSTAIGGYDFYIDGRLRASQVSGTLAIDTTTLADGIHDLRVLARDNSTQKTSGRWSGTLITSNFSRSVSLTVGPAAGNLAQAFTFQAAAAGGSVSSLRLLHNGRVIASARTPDAVFSIFGNTLGADTSDLRAEAIFTDGKRALSAPVTVTVAPTGSPAPVAPRAFGYTKFITPTNPATPTIVELPATFDSVLDSATYTILSNPAQATISGGNTLPYRLVTAAPGAGGSDTISFRVNTLGGASSTAFITLVYSGIPSCVADLDDGNATGTPDGGVGIEDLLYYLGLYDAGLARADVDDGSGLGQPDGGVGIEDLLFYLSRYDAGC